MISYNNHNDIKQINYNNHSIKYVYGCGGNLVWSGSTRPTGHYKVNRLTIGDVWTEVDCDSSDVITQSEILRGEHGIILAKSSFKELAFGDCITSIGTTGDSAASGCCNDFDALTAVTIPNNVTTIGNNAFYSCNSLTEITLPYTITTIGQYAFGSCPNLTSFTILALTPPPLTYLDDIWNTNTTVYVPDSVVDVYKSTPLWKTYPDRIKPLSQKP